MSTKTFLSFCVLLLSVVALSGCSFDEARSGALKIWDSGKNKVSEVVGQPNENTNPEFTKVEEVSLETENLREIDRYLKENFRKIFGEAKIVEVGQLRSTPFTFQYVMKNKIKQTDLELLSAKFLETSSFAKEDSPILQDEKGLVGQFGLYHNFGGRRYVLAFLFDYEKQLVWVNIY